MELNFLISDEIKQKPQKIYLSFTVFFLCAWNPIKGHTYLNNPVSFTCRKSEEVKGNLKLCLLLVDRSNCYAQVCVTGLFFADSFGLSSRVIFLSRLCIPHIKLLQECIDTTFADPMG